MCSSLLVYFGREQIFGSVFCLHYLSLYFIIHFSLTPRVTMIFIWTCIFVRAPSCSLFLITDHVTYFVDYYTRRKHLSKLQPTLHGALRLDAFVLAYSIPFKQRWRLTSTSLNAIHCQCLSYNTVSSSDTMND